MKVCVNRKSHMRTAPEGGALSDQQLGLRRIGLAGMRQVPSGGPQGNPMEFRGTFPSPMICGRGFESRPPCVDVGVSDRTLSVEVDSLTSRSLH